MFFGCHAQLIVKGVVPNLLHVVPIRHDAMLDGILQGQYTSLALRLVTNIAIFLVHSDHDAWHLRAAHDGREDSARRVVSCKTCLAHTTAIVNDKRCTSSSPIFAESSKLQLSREIARARCT